MTALRAALVLLLAVAVVAVALPAPAAQPSPSPSSRLPSLPPGLPTPGERNPLVGGLAVVALVVAGAAGIWIYRVIRKGL